MNLYIRSNFYCGVLRLNFKVFLILSISKINCNIKYRFFQVHILKFQILSFEIISACGLTSTPWSDEKINFEDLKACTAFCTLFGILKVVHFGLITLGADSLHLETQISTVPEQ